MQASTQQVLPMQDSKTMKTLLPESSSREALEAMEGNGFINPAKPLILEAPAFQKLGLVAGEFPSTLRQLLKEFGAALCHDPSLEQLHAEEHV